MKKLYFLLAAMTAPALINAEPNLQVIDGVPVLVQFYGHKMSADGTQLVGEAEDGSAVYYNIPDNIFYTYLDCNFGRGNVIADDGTVVGSLLTESDTQSTIAVLMKDGEITVPPVFEKYVSSNIHSITPDGSRICGVVGNSGKGASNFPFYCDRDANGNYSELKFLPYPEKDLMGDYAQYCSATCMSDDGKRILGQVIDNHGTFIYPIQYVQGENGEWEYNYPAESLFNTENLPLPDPFEEFEMKEPEPTDWMDDSEKEEWDEAMLIWEQNSFDPEYSPYDHLEWFLTQDEIEDYLAALSEYEEAAEEYNEKYFLFWERYYAIMDCSVNFERNAMALSPNGKWMAAAQAYEKVYEDTMDYVELFYRPYEFNLLTGEVGPIAEAELNLGISQAFNNGDVICVTPVASVLPPRSWLYKNAEKELISFEDYIKEVNPTYGDWYEENLYAYIPVADNEDGTFEYVYATITGLVSASEDLTMICGGVVGDAIDFGVNLSYLFSGLPADVKGIESDLKVENVYAVYNLQGVKVMTTKDVNNLNTLSNGVYIINGKKVMLRK